MRHEIPRGTSSSASRRPVEGVFSQMRHRDLLAPHLAPSSSHSTRPNSHLVSKRVRLPDQIGPMRICVPSQRVFSEIERVPPDTVRSDRRWCRGALSHDSIGRTITTPTRSKRIVEQLMAFVLPPLVDFPNPPSENQKRNTTYSGNNTNDCILPCIACRAA